MINYQIVQFQYLRTIYIGIFRIVRHSYLPDDHNKMKLEVGNSVIKFSS